MIQKLLLFGYPVAHSRSPVIHNAALQAVDLADWVYAAQAVPPDELPMAVARLRQPDYIGANVTIPHKERIIPLLDDLTPAAQAIGAVNTIFKDGKRLVGENTDAPGFLADLKHHLVRQAVSLSKDEQADRLPYNDVGRTVNLSKASLFHQAQADSLPYRALLLGAGGSARAVLYALHQADWSITIAARRLEQAQALSAAYPTSSVQAIELNPASLYATFLSFEKPSMDLLVNTTPLGMYPDVQGCAWPTDLPLPSGSFVYDLVYQPPQTFLLQLARAAGLPHANGLGMLVEQAAMAFERWTGLTAPRAVMFQAVQV